MSIQVKNLSVDYGDREILSDINFSCDAGEMIAIIGENGAGKSTLIQCLAGAREFSGKIILNHQPIGDYSVTQLARARAVLPQHTTLNFPLNVSDVVRLSMCLAPVSLSEQQDIIDRSLRLVDASGFAHRNYILLSGGEKQRVQLARIIAQVSTGNKCQPRYLMLDEPTSALDLCHQYSTLRLLRKLCEQNIGVFIIVHDLNLASLYCDRLLLLKDGKLVSYDTPNKVLQAENVKETFNIDVSVSQHPDEDKPFLTPRLR